MFIICIPRVATFSTLSWYGLDLRYLPWAYVLKVWLPIQGALESSSKLQMRVLKESTHPPVFLRHCKIISFLLLYISSHAVLTLCSTKVMRWSNNRMNLSNLKTKQIWLLFQLLCSSILSQQWDADYHTSSSNSFKLHGMMRVRVNLELIFFYL